jgi:hypothetical protein
MKKSALKDAVRNQVRCSNHDIFLAKPEKETHKGKIELPFLPF